MAQEFSSQVRLLVLACLRQHPHHYCFGITNWITRKSGLYVTVGEVHRTLKKFSSNDFVVCWRAPSEEKIAGPDRQYYSLTVAGHHHAEAERLRLMQIPAAMQLVVELLAGNTDHAGRN
jgi:DNA-binding PadR family transcriptional regulator